MAPPGMMPVLLDLLAVLAAGALCWAGGKVAQQCRLPLITGYLLVRELEPGLLVMTRTCCWHTRFRLAIVHGGCTIGYLQGSGLPISGNKLVGIRQAAAFK